MVFFFFAWRLADDGDAVVDAVDDRGLVRHEPGRSNWSCSCMRCL